MTHTLVGPLLASHGQIVVDDYNGRSFEHVDLAARQPRRIALVADHRDDLAIGDVLRIEQRSDGSTVIVAVCDDVPADHLEGLHLSGHFQGHSDGVTLHDATIQHVSLVERGAALAGPITVLADFDARQHANGLPHHTPLYMHELIAHAHEEHRANRYRYEARRLHRLDVEARNARGDLPPQARIEHSAAAGRVLSVR